MFTRAIVKTPCKNMVNGLTSSSLGTPDYEKALHQHQAYIAALTKCGLQVTVLPSDEKFPDSTFVEDTALLTPTCAIITNPGALSRRNEIAAMEPAIQNFYTIVEHIQSPGTVEAGDVMMVGSHFYIGVTERTNQEGARQLIDILTRHGMTGSTVPVGSMLHLKTGVSYLENNTMITVPEFANKPEFQQYRILTVAEEESYAANSVWVNNHVLVPKGFPKAAATISDAGYSIIEVDVSEFRKLDGGLSCLSLRF